MSTPSYSRGPEAPILEQTIGEMTVEIAARYPDREALISRHQNIRLSWHELDREIDRTARGLSGLGLAPPDRVGVWSTNCAMTSRPVSVL